MNEEISPNSLSIADPDDVAPPELSEDDEALLLDFGLWLQEREAEEAVGDLDVVIPPPPPALTEAELEGRVEAMLGQPPPRRRWAKVASHLGMVAATVVAIQFWPVSEPEVALPLLATYQLELRGGESKTLNPSQNEPTYSPSSTFDLVLRADLPVEEPTEVVIEARRVEAADGGFVRIQLPSALLEPNEGNVLHYVGPTHQVLPLAPGRWSLTIRVGPPGACILSSEAKRCAQLELIPIVTLTGEDDAT